MLKIKNKFIIFIIIIILLIIWIWMYFSFSLKNKDKDSFVILVSWQAKLNDKFLKINESKKLSVWDTVITIWNNALAVLEWWDWSVTRLWWDSSIKVWELYVSNDLSKMNISFELLSWKSWSNVISFFWEWSYFKEYFRDSEAAVRWTVFDIDLNKNYLYVTNHKVNLTTKNKWLIVVNEENPLNINTFNFISLQDFIKLLKDKSWEELNLKIDKEFLNWLKSNLNSKLEDLIKLRNLEIDSVIWDQIKKEKLYNELLTNYQELNFVNPEDWELFKLKLELKDKLLQLAEWENKDILVNSVLYDFKEIINSKKYENIDLLLWILLENKTFLRNIDLNDYFKDFIIPDNIKEKILNQFGDLKGFFINTFNTFKTNNVGIEDIKNIEQKANWLIQDWLDTLFNK